MTKMLQRCKTEQQKCTHKHYQPINNRQIETLLNSKGFLCQCQQILLYTSYIAHTHTRTHARMHARTHTHTHTHAHTHTHTHWSFLLLFLRLKEHILKHSFSNLYWQEIKSKSFEIKESIFFWDSLLVLEGGGGGINLWWLLEESDVQNTNYYCHRSHIC